MSAREEAEASYSRLPTELLTQIVRSCTGDAVWRLRWDVARVVAHLKYLAVLVTSLAAVDHRTASILLPLLERNILPAAERARERALEFGVEHWLPPNF